MVPGPPRRPILTPESFEIFLLAYRVHAEHERARAEEALRESEERFRALVQNSSDITVILEPDATVRYASPALERILGYPPESIIGEDPFDYIHPDDLEKESLALFDPRFPPISGIISGLGYEFFPQNLLEFP